MIWCFLTPVVGAVVAEQYLGRVKTILYSAAIYGGGLPILVLSSLPAVQETVISLLGLLLSLFLIGVGTGGIKANVNPLLAEQYTSPGPVFRLLKSGEKVVIDRDLTVQRSVPRLPSYAKFDSRQDVCNLFSLYQHRLSCCSGFGRNRTILRVLGSIRHPNDRLDHWLHSIRDQQRPVYQ